MVSERGLKQAKNQDYRMVLMTVFLCLPRHCSTLLNSGEKLGRNIFNIMVYSAIVFFCGMVVTLRELDTLLREATLPFSFSPFSVVLGIG